MAWYHWRTPRGNAIAAMRLAEPDPEKVLDRSELRRVARKLGFRNGKVLVIGEQINYTRWGGRPGDLHVCIQYFSDWRKRFVNISLLGRQRDERRRNWLTWVCVAALVELGVLLILAG